MSGILKVVERICALRQDTSSHHSTLVALSGIDGSGKGYITGHVADQLRQEQFSVAAINIDGWLNLPPIRFSHVDAARHFYMHAIRFDSMFSELVLPLRNSRSIHVEVEHAEETATEFTKRTYSLHDVDIVLLEGIYLLKPAFRQLYDLAIWIHCSFETALERAIARAQENLSPAATINAYQTIYFPAQEIHFTEDDPVTAADVILVNDRRLQPAAVFGR